MISPRRHEEHEVKEKKMKKLIILIIVLAAMCVSVSAQDQADQPIAIKAKKIVTVSGKSIDNGVILVKGGKIEAVGASIAIPEGAILHEYKDAIVYPGLINAFTTLGNTGISAIRQWNDAWEVGLFKPNLSAFTAFYPWSNLIPISREFGTLTALTVPGMGLIPGKAVLFDLHGWSPEDMFIRKEAALVMAVPEPPDPPLRTNKRYKKRLERVKKQKKDLWAFVDKAHKYYQRAKKGGNNPFNPKYEAMKDLWEHQLPAIINASSAGNIRWAIKLAKTFKFKAILADVYEGEEVLAEIKNSGFPVILGSMYSRNRKWDDGLDKVFRLPAQLAAKGIPFAFSSSWGSAAFDLPLNAGRTVAYGLSQEEAVKGLTLYPAKILGLTGYGSIEPGKIANLVIADGNILETSTVVKDVFIKGKKVTGKSFFRREYHKAEAKISGE